MSVKNNQRAIKRLQDAEYDYACWIEEQEKKTKMSLKHIPFISVILYGKDVEEEKKERCLSSIKQQKYKKLQILFGQEETMGGTRLYGEIKGEYVMFLHMADWLAPNALFEFASMIEQHPDAQWIYADEDVYREIDKKRVVPHFKPEWSYDTFFSFFYTGNASIYKMDICKEIKDWQIDFSYYWTYDFAMHFLEVCEQNAIYHIPKVLYHVSDEAKEKGNQQRGDIKSFKEDYLKRQNINGYVELESRTGEYRVVYKGKGFVSIVIPSKDNVDMLMDCITSIEDHTTYKEYEIVVVDNGSKSENKERLETWLDSKSIKYVYQPMDFNFSKMCNIGAAASTGEYLLFLNDDIECIDDKWLDRMVGQVTQPGVGAVGAKLLYFGNNKIQHIGVVNFNMDIGPSHILTRQPDNGVLVHGRNCLDYDYEAVTGACLLVKKDLYEEVGGFDEKFPIAYNDVDFCYKIRENGYRNVVRTDAVLIHHESVSRGVDAINDEKMHRLLMERKALYTRFLWILEKGDRGYNKNYSVEDTDCRLVNAKTEKGYNGRVLPSPYVEVDFYVIIERVIKGQELLIDGWYWYSDDTYTNLSDVYIVFRNNTTQKEIWYNTCKKTRYDASENSENEAFYCGFVCRVLKEEMEKLQGYKIGVCVQTNRIKRSPLTWTENIVE